VKAALLFLAVGGLIVSSCTSKSQPPKKDVLALSTNEVEVTIGSTDGLQWSLTVRHEGMGECLSFVNGPGRSETCGPLDIALVNAERLNASKRLDNLHFKCIDFVLGAVRPIVTRVRVDAAGMDAVELDAISVADFDTKFFITQIPLEILDVTVSGLDSHGTIVGNQLIPADRSSGACDE
jgi:hypothetical protein